MMTTTEGSTPVMIVQQGERDWDSTSTSSDYDGDGCKDETEDLDDDNDSWSDSEEATCISDALDAQSVPDNFDAYHEIATESETSMRRFRLRRRCRWHSRHVRPNMPVQCLVPIHDPVSNSISAVDEDFDNDGCFNEEDKDTRHTMMITTTCLIPSTDARLELPPETTLMETAAWTTKTTTWTMMGSPTPKKPIVEAMTPSDNSSTPVDNAHDHDQDSICDALDPDDDNDGLNDDDGDVFPKDASTEQYDFDGDGIGDNADNDDDDDGSLDVDDAFPKDASEQSDFDGDGRGDNQDVDDDGDQWLDAKELQCGSDP